MKYYLFYFSLLHISLAHTQVVEQLAYFIRKEDCMIMEETFESYLQFGTLPGGGIASLLRLMNGIHAPLVTYSTDWPESIKNNYLAHMHRFITYLTGTQHNTRNSTLSVGVLLRIFPASRKFYSFWSVWPQISYMMGRSHLTCERINHKLLFLFGV